MDTLFLMANSTAVNILVPPSFCECSGGPVRLITKWIKVGVLRPRGMEHRLRGTSNPLKVCAEFCTDHAVFQAEGPLLLSDPY